MTMFTYDENLFSDLHKEAYGSRPTSWAWAEWREASPSQKQVIWDELCEAHERAIEEEEARHNAAIKDFESRVSDLMTLGARDRETAIRWLVESLNLSEIDKMYGSSYICFKFGLPYSMSPTFEQIAS